MAVWATNVPAWPILQFATARIGAVLVTINPAYRPFELHYVLRQSDAVALFLVDQFKSSDYFAMLAEVCPEMAVAAPGEIASDEFPRLRWVVSLKGEPPPGAICWDELRRRGAGAETDRAVGNRAFAVRPDQHPVHLRHDRLSQGGDAEPSQSALQCVLRGRMPEHYAARPDLHPGAVLSLFRLRDGNDLRGGSRRRDDRTGRAFSGIRHARRHRARAGDGHLRRADDVHRPVAARELRRRDLSSLRTGIMAGSPCPIEVMRQVIRQMGAGEVTIAYGQTEASPVITQTRMDDPSNCAWKRSAGRCRASRSRSSIRPAEANWATTSRANSARVGTA